MVGPVAAETPDCNLHLVLKQSAGSSFGYGPPEVGSVLDFNPARLEKNPSPLGLRFQGNYVYIPLPASLKVVDVDHYTGNKKDWSSFRAISEKSSHRVTVDVIKTQGTQCRAWILVESRKRTVGTFYLEGSFNP